MELIDPANDARARRSREWMTFLGVRYRLASAKTIVPSRHLPQKENAPMVYLQITLTRL